MYRLCCALYMRTLKGINIWKSSKSVFQCSLDPLKIFISVQGHWAEIFCDTFKRKYNYYYNVSNSVVITITTPNFYEKWANQHWFFKKKAPRISLMVERKGQVLSIYTNVIKHIYVKIQC